MPIFTENQASRKASVEQASRDCTLFLAWQELSKGANR